MIRGAPLCDRRSARTTGPRVRYVAVCREGRRRGRSSLEIVLLGPAHAPGTAHRAVKSCSAKPWPFHGATGSAWWAPWAEDPAPEPSAIEADACSRKRACAKMRMGEASRARQVLTAPAVGPRHRAKICCPHGPRAQAWRAAWAITARSISARASRTRDLPSAKPILNPIRYRNRTRIYSHQPFPRHPNQAVEADTMSIATRIRNTCRAW